MTETIIAGPLALTLYWEEGMLRATALSRTREAAASEPATPYGRALAAALARYVAGEAAPWPEAPLAWERLTDFRRVVLSELTRVAHGRTVTYAELAARAGRPGASRAVGAAMAANPWPLIVPCHRVVGAAGLTGYGPGLDLKRELLELEGAL